MKHVKWPSTRRFSDMVITMKAIGLNEATFIPKIKLHGANIAIRHSKGEWSLQGRNNVLSLSDDLFSVCKELRLPTDMSYNYDFLIYGEWAGPGCAKDPDVVGEISQKTFFPFAVACACNGVFDNESLANNEVEVFTKPAIIQDFLNNAYKGDVPENIKVLPYMTDLTVTIRAFDPDHNKREFERVMSAVAQIGKSDPYIKEVFGIDGRGEGMVYIQDVMEVPAGKMPMLFKVKTEHHDVVKRAAVKHEVVIPEGVAEFVENFFTRQRVEQMAFENGNLEICLKNAGPLIKFTIQDALKEGANEIEVGNLNTKDIGRMAPDAIRRIIVNVQNEKAFA